MWKPFELRENGFDLEFVPPANYFELRRQQIMDLKLNNFTNITGNESISQGYGQKEWLGWTDEMVKANRAWLRKDAALQHELEQIRGGGADWAAGGGGAPAAGGGVGGAPHHQYCMHVDRYCIGRLGSSTCTKRAAPIRTSVSGPLEAFQKHFVGGAAL